MNEDYTLAELSDILYLFGNDLRMLHLHTIGDGFFTYHEKLNELYDIVFDMYDAVAEMSISHGEEIINPSAICLDNWDIEVDRQYDRETIIDIVVTKGKRVIDCINHIAKYESFVQSKIDSFTEDLDKYINYMFVQCSK